VLFLDAAGSGVFAGVWRAGAWLACRRGDTPNAGECLFALTDSALAEAGTRLDDCAAFAFAEGPGSILGVRVAAMALGAWRVLPRASTRPVFAAGSLALAARLLLRSGVAGNEFSLLSDSRQGFWNSLAVRGGVPAEDFEEVPAAGLAALPRPFFHIARPGHPAPPVDRVPFPANLLERDPEVFFSPGLFRETDTPDAANPAVRFVKWTPERHRA
jgi:tRNA threonylcarbamoyladenosine biosynthesis protein TsaB